MPVTYKKINKLQEEYMLASLELDAAHAARIAGSNDEIEDRYAEAYRKLLDLKDELRGQ